MAEEQNNPAKPNAAYTRMIAMWALIDDLFSGTRGMRDAGELYLPKFEAESDRVYESRKKMAYLYPGLEHAINGIVSQPFAKATTTTRDLPAWMGNLDLTSLLSKVFLFANKYGVGHVLIDFPRGTAAPGEVIPAPNARKMPPSFTPINPNALINWRYADDGELEFICIAQTAEEPSGEFGVNIIDEIMWVGRDEWRTYRPKKGEDGAWVVDDEGMLIDGNGNALQKVPLASYFIGEHTGLEVQRPPHRSLADINLAHYQSLADQRNIEHYARVPFLFGRGIRPEEKEGFKFAPGKMLTTESKEATLGFIEHQGRAIESGRADLQDLEKVMQALGMAPLIQSMPGDVKATAIAVDKSSSDTLIQRWVRDEETFALDMLKIAADWYGEELPTDLRVQIHQDFAVPFISGASDGELLLKARATNEIDQLTFLKELRRRSLLSEQTDVEEIIRLTEADEIMPEPGPTPDNE